MHNILLRIGNLTIYTYSAWVALALLATLGVAWLRGRQVGLRQDVVLDASLAALLGGVVGARLEYVLLNIDYFREQPVAALRIWQGGMALHGGLWLGLLALLVYTRSGGMAFGRWADTLALGLSGGAMFAWLAALYGGYAYGRTGFGPLYFNWYDTFGVSASRFAVQPLGAALSLALFVGLLVVARRNPPAGSVLLLYLAISGLIQLGLGFFRADETSMWWSWRADQWLNLVQVFVSGSIMAYLVLSRTPNPPEDGSQDTGSPP